jgi:hypothetical protein
VEVRDGQHDLRQVEARELLAERALPVELEEEMAAVDEVEQQVELGASLQGGTRLGTLGVCRQELERELW